VRAVFPLSAFAQAVSSLATRWYYHNKLCLSNS